jgi:uncharacterized protein YecE (DUF72 family)
VALTEADYRKYVRWGTSTWTFEGWKNQVYFNAYQNTNHFNHASLKEYCAFPRFGVIGMDLWYYRTPTEDALREYEKYIPAGFPICVKVVNDLCTFRWPKIAANRALAGSVNPDFLNAEKFLNEFLPPFRAVFQERPLVFIFELMTIADQDLPGGVAEFSGILDLFLAKLPKDLRCAFEIRNKNFINPIYFGTLKKHGAAHCFNQWARQLSIGQQLKIAGDLTDFVVVRALQPAGWSHTQSESFFKPFHRIKVILPEVRQDILNLIRSVLVKQVYAYILINNRLEGNAPTTIAELDELVLREVVQK